MMRILLAVWTLLSHLSSTYESPLWHLLHTLVWLSAQSPKKRSCFVVQLKSQRGYFFFFFENSVSTDRNLIKKIKINIDDQIV